MVVSLPCSIRVPLLVTVYGQDVTGWGRELHGQVRGGDDYAKCIKGRTAQEDVVRCWRIDNKEAD